MRVAIAFLAVLLMSTSTFAEFDSDYWSDMTKSEQSGYVSGILDALTTVSEQDAVWRIQTMKALRRCLARKEVTPELIMGRITAHYESHVDERSYPISSVLMVEVLFDGGLCEQERKEIVGE